MSLAETTARRRIRKAVELRGYKLVELDWEPIGAAAEMCGPSGGWYGTLDRDYLPNTSPGNDIMGLSVETVLQYIDSFVPPPEPCDCPPHHWTAEGSFAHVPECRWHIRYHLSVVAQREGEIAVAGTNPHVPRWVLSTGACDCGCICAANDCPISHGKPNCYVCRTSGASCPHQTIQHPFVMPDRIAIDAKGYGWRVWDAEDYWSMVPVNPDNSPIPKPVTWFIPVPTEPKGATVTVVAVSPDELRTLVGLIDPIMDAARTMGVEADSPAGEHVARCLALHDRFTATLHRMGEAI